MLISVAQHLVRLRLRNICSNTQNIFRNFHSFIRLNETDLIRRFTIAVLLKPSQGTYFQNLDYSQIRPDLNDVEMCQFLAEQHKIVAIPVSVFYQQAPESLRLIRFCFAKMMKHCKSRRNSESMLRNLVT